MDRFNPIERSPELSPQPEKDYLAELNFIYERLKKQKSADIRFGPRYHMNTSAGNPLAFDTAVITMKKNLRRNYLVFARDQSGNITGHETLIMDRMSNGFLKVEGTIATAHRGQGIAMPIDLVAEDLLQREASFMNEEMLWVVSNHNAVVLRDLKFRYRRNPSEELSRQVQEKTAEQERWLAVFGLHGKRGFGARGEKFIKPQSDRVDLELVDKVALRREGDKSLVESETKMDENLRGQIREKKQRQFQELVLTIQQTLAK